MTKKRERIVIISLAMACCILSAYLPRAAAQALPGHEVDLASLIPPEAFAFFEKRSIRAVAGAFAASNMAHLGKDAAIVQFLNDTRSAIELQVIGGLLDLDNADDVAESRELLHKCLKPVWYERFALFAMLEKDFDTTPGVGMIWLTGEHRKESEKALDALLTRAASSEKVQPFTYRKGMCLWRGVAKGDALPDDPLKRIEELKKRECFMVGQMHPLAFAATKFSTAQAIMRALRAPGRVTGKNADKGFQLIKSKTMMKDWFIRWHVDIDALIRAAVRSVKNGDALPKMVYAAGLDQVGGIGGSQGFADGVWTSRMYISVRGKALELLRVFKRGGSYKPALQMVPADSVICLAGQLDTDSLLKKIQELILAGMREKRSREMATTAPATASSAVVTTAPAVTLDEKIEQVLKQLKVLSGASNGCVAMYLSDLQIMGMASDAPSVGVVLDLNDRAKAVKAIDRLVELDRQADGEQSDAPVAQETYRKVTIRYLGKNASIAVLADRAVLASTDSAMKAVIDASLDKTGGFKAGSEKLKLINLAGDGSMMFMLDTKAVIRTVWPLLMQVSSMQSEDGPFKSLPSTNKMVGAVGSLIIVAKPDDTGLLLESRSKVPLMGMSAPYAAVGLFW